MSASNEDSESVDQFLARIASLKDRRDREDEARTRKLEEDILQGRRERQARRAERARSLSPAKASPTPSATSVRDVKPFMSQSIEPPADFNLQSQQNTPSKTRELPPPPRKDLPETTMPAPNTRTIPRPMEQGAPQTNAGTLGRSGTLSWQQRPSSRDSDSSRFHPHSGPSSAAASPAVRSLTSQSTEDLSRNQIAQSLGSKDPSWFRQTADRAVGSAAYRKTQVEDAPDYSTYGNIGPSRMPGMSRETTVEAERPQTPLNAGHSADAQASASRPNSASQRGRSSEPSRPYPTNNTFAAPLSSSQVFDPLSRNVRPDSEDGHTTPATGLAIERAPSPTKGLGGFVQSAMMKRSDSVNKRWNVQANTGLKRGDSVASNRTTLAAAGSGGWSGSARSPTRNSRMIGSEPPSSPLGSPRPSPRHAREGSVEQAKVADLPERRVSSEHTAAPTPTKPVAQAVKPVRTTLDTDLPISPSKTMDSRRWSPTKASWLESALTKPESPKLSPTRTDQQPAWKADLQRSREGKPSTSSYEAVKTDSLMRSPPPGGHMRPLSISGVPNISGVATRNSSNEAPYIKTDNGILQPTNEPASTSPALEEQQEKFVAPIRVANPIETDQGSIRNTPAIDEKAPEQISRPIKPQPMLKPKPQTPPKNDLRANLKARQSGSEQQNNVEPEFKAMFGKLKRTQPQNYVAPDQLKDNITRGKNALSVTGGPQKAKHVDDFKESILQKKETMRQSSGSTPSTKPSVPEKPSAVLPEALARRKTLKQANSGESGLDENKPPPPSRPTTFGKSPVGSTNSSVASNVDRSQPGSSTIALHHNSNLSEKQETSVRKQTEVAKPQDSPAGVPPPTRELSDNSKLAARLNPSLAGFLSRSSSPKLSGSTDKSTFGESNPSKNTSVPSLVGDDANAALTHMTKARARGPKRRLPKSEISSAVTAESVKQDVDAGGLAPPTTQFASRPSSAAVKAVGSENASLTPKPLSLRSNLAAQSDATWTAPQGISKPTDSSRDMHQTQTEAKIRSLPNLRPTVAAKSPELRKVSSPPNSQISSIASAVKPSTQQSFEIATDRHIAKAPQDESVVGKTATVSSTSHINAMPLAPSTTKMNSSRINRGLEGDALQKEPHSKPSSKPQGLGLKMDAPLVPQSLILRSQPTTQADKSISPIRSTTKESSSDTIGTTHKLQAFFGSTPKIHDKAEYDPQAILKSSTQDEDKIKTLTMQIWEVAGDGKKQSMPPQQEHILFEECMYLCVHTYSGWSGTKAADVYLWCGDGVAEGAVEDAQLFCKKVARDNNTRLEVVRQGKEPARFFQAIGGILITRRSRSAAIYMLCGRRHHGHVVFDEVELDVASLCSGFPFILSGKFGKLYLWKGRGSGADEVGCARLIGMDLGLTGEIEEVAEGEEPIAFFDSLAAGGKPAEFASSDLWELKSRSEGYTSKLYRVEHDRPKSAGGLGSLWGRRGSSPSKSSNKALIQEIAPYSRSDLEAGHVYVLDAYLEIYVFVGAAAKSRNAEFVTACMLAQDLSMLSPSIQDRPLMPSCCVVFGEPPKDFKATFRKWQTRSPAGESSTLPLADVIEAMG